MKLELECHDQRMTLPWSPRPGIDPLEIRVVSYRPNGHSDEGGSAHILQGVLTSAEETPDHT